MVLHRPNKTGIVILSRSEGVRYNRFTTPLTSDRHGRIISANPKGKDVFVFDIVNDKAVLHRTYTADIRLWFGFGILSVDLNDQNCLWVGTAPGNILIARYTE